MSNNITLNIVEPGSGPAVPDTGLFTAGIGGPEATAIGAVIVLAIATIVVAILYKKHKKQNKTTKLVHLVDSIKAVIANRKRITTSLTALALLASAGTFSVLLSTANKNNTSALEGEEETITPVVSNEELTIELSDEPVFAILPVDITVEQATEAGYTLTAYTDSTDLVSTTDDSNTISMVTVEGDELVALTDNTYGLALAEPASQAEEVYTTLSTDADAPTFITDKDHKATEAGDTTTIYYGFYITPDVPYGTYTGSDIYYDVEENYITNLSFDGNGSDGGEEMASVTIPAGGSTTLPPNTYTKTGYDFAGWNTNAAGTGENYADGAEYTAVEGEFAEVILYAQWYKQCPANNICYRGNGASTATDMDNVEQYTTGTSTGKQVDLLASNFTKPGHGFVGWSEDKDAWTHLKEKDTATPTIYGPNQTITVGDLSEEGMKLYAIWAPAETSVTMQTFNPNSEPYASKTSGYVIALKDERDEEVYAVAKLADGNWWMIENLRLDNSETYESTTEELSSSNTNNPSLPLTNNYSSQTTSNRLSISSNNWCTDYDSAPCYDQSKLNTNNIANTATFPAFSQDFTSSAHENFDFNISSYGTYYNWYSATAGNGTYSTGEQGVETVAGDICPAGWILPIGGQTDTNGSFSHLDVSMGGTGVRQGSTEASNRWRSFPNNFVYSGYWGGSSANYRGDYGYYWSSTADYTGSAYYLYFYNGSVYPGTNGNDKDYGNSVRCVAPAQ